jgi:Uma2 family endonuclease
MGTTTALRADDLMTLPHPPEGAHYELSQGELITVAGAGYRHEFVKSDIHRLLIIWDPQRRYGRVFGETTFRLKDDTARQPDVAFVSNDRLAGVPVEDRLISFVPNIAIEVISKSESAEDAEIKVQEYLTAGVDEVWQVYPEARVVHIRSASGVRELRPDQTLESPVLPGFSVRVGDFFEGKP